MNLHLEKEALKKEIDYIEDKNILQTIKAILSYAHQSQEIWEDSAFEQELKRRSAAFRSGKSKRYTWQQTKTSAQKRLKAKSKATK